MTSGRTPAPEPPADLTDAGSPLPTEEPLTEPGDSVADTSVVWRPRRVRVGWALALVALLVVVTAASLMIGSRTVSPGDVWAALTGTPHGIDQAAVAKRIPRTVMCLVTGASLALCGVVMQGVTRNPLADPGILGVNTGASLAIAIGVAFFSLSSYSAMIWVALIGAAATAALVYVMGSLGSGGATPLKLALAGSATAAALASLTSAVVLPRSNIADGIRSWQVGGVGGATWDALGQAVPYFVVGALICLGSASWLNSLALGDELAAGLGTRVGVARGVASLGAVLLAAATTAVCGPIGFVGLVVPHVVRLLSGPDHRWLLPLSALAGAVLITVSDIVGRVILPPTEVEVGVITAVIGAPFFISIVRRQKVREL